MNAAVPSSTSSKPLPLKQRTSSIDGRRDYNVDTLVAVIGLLKLREFFITVDHFSIWKRHLAWAIENGKDLRDYMTQRYSSSMVFLSLLLSTELGVLFNSAQVTTSVRQSLHDQDHTSLHFWIGMTIILSVILTLVSLIATFTAWTMVSAVSEANAHCIFRSSIGQYVAELPGKFIVGSIYSFLLWVILYFFVLLPIGVWSILLLTLALTLFIHTITAFSAFGRIIMHSGAMGSKRIFEPEYEASLLPHTLQQNLLIKARARLENQTSIRRQYESNSKPMHRPLSSAEDIYNSDTWYGTTSSNSSVGSNDPTLVQVPNRGRTASLVRFSDGFDTNGQRLDDKIETPYRLPQKEITINQSTGSATPFSTLSTDEESSAFRLHDGKLSGTTREEATPSPMSSHSEPYWNSASTRTTLSSTASRVRDIRNSSTKDVASLWIQASASSTLQRSMSGSAVTMTPARPSAIRATQSLELPLHPSHHITEKAGDNVLSRHSRDNRQSKHLSNDTIPTQSKQVGEPSPMQMDWREITIQPYDGDMADIDEAFDREYGDLFESSRPSMNITDGMQSSDRVGNGTSIFGGYGSTGSVDEEKKSLLWSEEHNTSYQSLTDSGKGGK